MFGASWIAIGIALFTGVGVGSVYALLALSITTLVATTDVFHFSLGSFVMLGTVTSYELARTSIPQPLILAIIVAGGAVLGVLSHRIAIEPVIRRTKHWSESVLVSTLALSLVIDGITAVRFGVDEKPVQPYVSGGPIMVGSIPLRPVYAVMFG